MIITLQNKTSHNIDENLIVSAVRNIFEVNNAPLNTEASIAVVNHQEVVDLAVLYMKESPEEAQEHPVLSFLNSELETPFIFPPDDEKHLGEIVVSYDKAVSESKESGKSVNEILAFWAEHAALHLMEIHHD